MDIYDESNDIHKNISRLFYFFLVFYYLFIFTFYFHLFVGYMEFIKTNSIINLQTWF